MPSQGVPALVSAPPRLSHRLEMAGMALVSKATRPLSPSRLAGVVGSLGALAGAGLRLRRAVVDQNLATAFPDRSARERRDLAVAAYRHLGAQSALLLRMLDHAPTRDSILDHVQPAGAEDTATLDQIAERARQGVGSLVLAAHLGNWEIAAGALAHRGLPLHAVANRQSNPLFDRRVTRMREALGIVVIPRDDAPKAVVRRLAEGCVVLLVADQFTWKGLPVRFFGEPTLAARGPATFARRAGVDSYVIAAVARSGQPERHVMLARPLPTPTPTGERGRAAAQAFLQAYTDVIESFIRAHPEQYLWHHRRWRPLEGRVDPDDLALLGEPVPWA